jgi:hypothetical protein
MMDGVAEVMDLFSGDWRPAPARDAERRLAAFRRNIEVSDVAVNGARQSKARRGTAGDLSKPFRRLVWRLGGGKQRLASYITIRTRGTRVP